MAESVTGGMISDRIVSIPGISSFFRGGVVVYSNESKVNILGVDEKTIVEHGAVSKACVFEMAKGALEVFKTDIAIATTGIAGPTGGTKDKPLGTVWFGLSSKFESQVWQKIYGGTRNEVRKAASDDALEALINMIANFGVIENGRR